MTATSYYLLARWQRSYRITYTRGQSSQFYPHQSIPSSGKFDELVNSDLQIMTTANPSSIISFIPGQKAGFCCRWKLGVKLHEFVRSISESRKLSKLGFDTAHTFAIMDSNTDIRPVQTWLRLNGKRLIIDSKEDTPFVMVWLTLGFKNCFHPMLSKWFAYFSASGIENKLEHQEWMRELFKRLIN
ncbi:hypothetical protein Fcan01_24395 [Folsomia candida]|uniref:Uncharacterized protein n=1 Tax=Folsomia candida TaxID=158441 RepID=A0A226D827_FOLCA|nr:hypothetical protein Fcan01_24395 [Folsomia candida]